MERSDRLPLQRWCRHFWLGWGTASLQHQAYQINLKLIQFHEIFEF